MTSPPAIVHRPGALPADTASRARLLAAPDRVA